MSKKYANRYGQKRIDRLCKIVSDELYQKECYLQQGFTARMLAERNGITVRDVSAVTNSCFGGNFSTLLQRLRVRKVCRMLSSKDYENVSSENIALRCGFSNRQSFYNAFHKEYDITPEEYRKQFLISNS